MRTEAISAKPRWTLFWLAGFLIFLVSVLAFSDGSAREPDPCLACDCKLTEANANLVTPLSPAEAVRSAGVMETQGTNRPEADCDGRCGDGR